MLNHIFHILHIGIIFSTKTFNLDFLTFDESYLDEFGEDVYGVTGILAFEISFGEEPNLFLHILGFDIIDTLSDDVF